MLSAQRNRPSETSVRHGMMHNTRCQTCMHEAEVNVTDS